MHNTAGHAAGFQIQHPVLKTKAHDSECSHQQFIFRAVTNLFMSVSIFVFHSRKNEKHWKSTHWFLQPGNRWTFQWWVTPNYI